MSLKNKIIRRKRRHKHIMKKCFGTKDVPRVIVYRSLRHFYAQAVDDEQGIVITGSSTFSPSIKTDVPYGGNKSAAEKVGELMAERLKEKGISKIVFDRAGYKYHGRVKECADAMRKGGLEF